MNILDNKAEYLVITTEYIMVIHVCKQIPNKCITFTEKNRYLRFIYRYSTMGQPPYILNCNIHIFSCIIYDINFYVL